MKSEGTLKKRSREFRRAFGCLASSPIILIRGNQQEGDASSFFSSLKTFEGIMQQVIKVLVMTKPFGSQYSC
jgi:hypothetical protein